MLHAGFPPLPKGLLGRSVELRTLSRAVRGSEPARLALVGSGGSGKSLLACALGHALAPHFKDRVDWFRVGAWDFRTLTEMMALRYGTSYGDARVERLREFLQRGGRRLVVLDNHEDDAATAELMQTLSDTPVSFIVTARRCLLAGVWIFPVTAPLVITGKSAFPRVQALTQRLRWSPLALDIADAIVRSRAASAAELAQYLDERGVTRVVAIEHEDDLPEVGLLVDFTFERLNSASRKLLAVLAHIEGDHVDTQSLFELADLGRTSRSALTALTRWHLVQEPKRGRFTLHAVVRHAIRKRTQFAMPRLFEHYIRLLETTPKRVELEQTHLFAAMDWAYRASDFPAILRVEALLTKLFPEGG